VQTLPTAAKNDLNARSASNENDRDPVKAKEK